MIWSKGMSGIDNITISHVYRLNCPNIACDKQEMDGINVDLKLKCTYQDNILILHSLRKEKPYTLQEESTID